MSQIDISQMDFKQLRKKVKELYDEICIMKRRYEDILYNLDDDNFSKRLVLEKNNMMASISLAADQIKTKLTREDMEKELKNYSTVTQTADAITATVTKEYVSNLAEDDGGWITNAVMESQIKQTSEEITKTVSSTYETKDNANEKYKLIDNCETKEDANNKYREIGSQITQTSESIQSIVSKNISAYFEKDTEPTSENTTSEDKSMLCLFDGVYYYYSDVNKKWLPYPADGLKTMFLQNAEGFELTGDVKVSGDLISGGTIEGVEVRTAKDEWGDGLRMYHDNDMGYYAFQLILSEQIIGSWGMNIGETHIGPVNGAKFYVKDATAKGTWDFSGADEIKGLSVPAVFG